MTGQEIVEALVLISRPSALRAEVEYELEDLGLITTDDGPYARLTKSGRALIDKVAAMREP